MLRRGELLEADLTRALDHVRESNKYLKEFVQLLETVDGDRWNEREHVRSWLEIAERVRSVDDNNNGDDDKDRRHLGSKAGIDGIEDHGSGSGDTKEKNDQAHITVTE